MAYQNGRQSANAYTNRHFPHATKQTHDVFARQIATI
jgi:hypothetical protein